MSLKKRIFSFITDRHIPSITIIKTKFMKTINSCIGIFLVMILPFIAFAQKASTPDARPTKTTVTYCDDMIAKTKVALDKQSSKTCSTAKRTIPCSDRKSGFPVIVTIISQPTKKGCPNIVQIKDVVASEPVSRGGGKEAAMRDFTVNVIQEQCSRGGVTLTAFIPDSDQTEKKKIFDVQWMTAGNVFDTDMVADCVTKDKITLKVTKIATGETIIKSITPYKGEVADESSKDPKMFGFEKTPCFGECPTYQVAIHESGKAVWMGKANVDKKGEWVATVGPKKMDYLKNEARKANYMSLNEKYPVEGQVADAPITITYVRDGDKEKVIKNTFGGPDALVSFEEALNKVISALAWKEVNPRD